MIRLIISNHLNEDFFRLLSILLLMTIFWTGSIQADDSTSMDWVTVGSNYQDTCPINYVVVANDTLTSIANANNVTLGDILSINDIPNPNLIYQGQLITIPCLGDSIGIVATQSSGFAYGIEVHLPGQDMNQVVAQARDIGMTWVKQELAWKDYEPQQGFIDFVVLDAMVDVLSQAGLNILFTVSKAPDWARSTSDEDGPPIDYQDYANFVGAVADRYQGRVQAYEIWNEQNLRREWNGSNLSAEYYVQLLALAYEAIKAGDPDAIVITGGLSPTGVNDGALAIDDRLYLQQMYQNGVARFSDAIGVHPIGWANPPNSVCCNNTPGVPTHDDHPSFFFRKTLDNYRNIMVRNGDGSKLLWSTKFGWGTNADLTSEYDPGFEFVTYVDLNSQATYIVDGFSYLQTLNYGGPAFLWNLNMCPVDSDSEECYWSLLAPAGNARPAYYVLKDVPK